MGEGDPQSAAIDPATRRSRAIPVIQSLGAVDEELLAGPRLTVLAVIELQLWRGIAAGELGCSVLQAVAEAVDLSPELVAHGVADVADAVARAADQSLGARMEVSAAPLVQRCFHLGVLVGIQILGDGRMVFTEGEMGIVVLPACPAVVSVAGEEVREGIVCVLRLIRGSIDHLAADVGNSPEDVADKTAYRLLDRARRQQRARLHHRQAQVQIGLDHRPCDASRISRFQRIDQIDGQVHAVLYEAVDDRTCKSRSRLRQQCRENRPDDELGNGLAAVGGDLLPVSLGNTVGNIDDVLDGAAGSREAHLAIGLEIAERRERASLGRAELRGPSLPSTVRNVSTLCDTTRQWLCLGRQLLDHFAAGTRRDVATAGDAAGKRLGLSRKTPQDCLNQGFLSALEHRPSVDRALHQRLEERLFTWANRHTDDRASGGKCLDGKVYGGVDRVTGSGKKSGAQKKDSEEQANLARSSAKRREG
jgi:hypothetical protein